MFYVTSVPLPTNSSLSYGLSALPPFFVGSLPDTVPLGGSTLAIVVFLLFLYLDLSTLVSSSGF